MEALLERVPFRREFFKKALKMIEICEERVKFAGDAFHNGILHKSVENERNLAKKNQNRRLGV